MSVDPYEGTVVGRDPITKTIVATFAARYPHLNDVELCEWILKAGRGAGADLSEEMTPAIVARWRPEATR